MPSELVLERKIGIAKPGSIRDWRAAPTRDAAIGAAATYAKKEKKPYLVVTGNSYMTRVYHVVEPETAMRKGPSAYSGMNADLRVYLVEPDGSTFESLLLAKKKSA